MEIFRLDLKRALFSRKMLFSVLLGISLIFIGMILEPIRSAISIYYSNATDLTLEIKNNLIANSFNKVTLWNFGNYFYIPLISLISCIPFTTEYIKEKKTGFSKYLIIRSNYKSYIISRILVTFISGFISIFIISLCTLILINIINSGNEFRSIFYNNTLFSNISTNNFNLFVLIHGLICSIMGGTYSLIGLCISSFVEKTFYAFTGPFFIYYIGNYVTSALNITAFSPDLLGNFYRYENLNILYILLQIVTLLLVSIITFLYKTYWSDTYE